MTEQRASTDRTDRFANLSDDEVAQVAKTGISADEAAVREALEAAAAELSSPPA